MRVEQSDVAALTDDQLKHLAVEWNKVACHGGRLEGFARGLSVELVRLVRERRLVALSVWEVFSELDNDDEAGALVEEGDDPTADALDELGKPPRWLR